MCSCAIMDYRCCQEFAQTDAFADFVPQGKPS
jgi:hypothetical protein